MVIDLMSLLDKYARAHIPEVSCWSELSEKQKWILRVKMVTMDFIGILLVVGIFASII